MERIYHPTSGERGFFCSDEEKILIDAVLVDFSINQSVLESSSRSARGGVNE